jgi:hypothetical protein
MEDWNDGVMSEILWTPLTPPKRGIRQCPSWEGLGVGLCYSYSQYTKINSLPETVITIFVKLLLLFPIKRF